MPTLRTTLALAAATLTIPSNAAYTIKDNYDPSSFFSKFSFWTSADPTHGYVQYVSEATAQTNNLIQTNSDSIYMGVDMNNTVPDSDPGRKSVRLSSTATYDNGLFVIDVAHMPVGCGAWPAFWLVGPNWPSGGEIDILEGVNLGTNNQATLHTSTGCTITKPAPDAVKAGTSVLGTSCASSGDNNAGCGLKTTDTSSYGTGLNSAGGAVYATEVTATNIKIWYWARGSEPADVKSGSPNPANWGSPFALFSGCDVQSHFKDMQIVFDTTFCGDWAKNVWTTDDQCSKKAATCEAYVKGHAEGFDEAFWKVNSLKVYTGDAGLPSNIPSQSSTTSKVNPTSSTVIPVSSSANPTPTSRTTYTPTGASTRVPTSTPSPVHTPYAPSFSPSWAAPGTATGVPSPSGQVSGGAAPSWGANGGHGGRGRPSDTPGSPRSDRLRRHLAGHAHGRMGRF